MLRSQVASLTRSLGPAGGAAAARFLPELDLALGSVVLLASAVRTGSTPGADLMNLRYVTTSPRKADSAGPGPGLGALRSKGRDASPYAPPVLCLAMLAAVSLGIRYGWSKLVSCCVKWGWASAPEGSWRRNVWRWMRHVEQAHALCRAANLVAFLYQGRYRTLAERLCGLRMDYVDPGVARAVSYEYLNQQLVWRELSELASAVMPLFDRRKAMAVWRFVLAPAVSAVMAQGRRMLRGPPRPAGASRAADGGAGTAGQAAARDEAGGRDGGAVRRQAAGVAMPAGRQGTSSKGGKGPSPPDPKGRLVLRLRATGGEAHVGDGAGADGAAQPLGRPRDASDLEDARDPGRVDANFKFSVGSKPTDSEVAPLGPGKEEQCTKCKRRDVALPFEALPCRHVFCYVCLFTECATDPGYCCPRCGRRVEELARWRGDTG